MRMFVAALLSLALLALPAGAELVIFDVRKNLRMSDSDPVYHDFYVSGGTEAGLSPGLVITVVRKLPLYDTYANHAVADLQLKVAKVKIIHAQKGLAVARLFSEFTRENAPLLEDNFIMVGDILDLATASAEGKSAAGESSGTTTSASTSPATNAVSSTTTPPPAIVAALSSNSKSQAKPAEKPAPAISVNSVSVSPKTAPAPVDAPKME